MKKIFIVLVLLFGTFCLNALDWYNNTKVVANIKSEEDYNVFVETNNKWAYIVQDNLNNENSLLSTINDCINEYCTIEKDAYTDLMFNDLIKMASLVSDGRDYIGLTFINEVNIEYVVFRKNNIIYCVIYME